MQGKTGSKCTALHHGQQSQTFQGDERPATGRWPVAIETSQTFQGDERPEGKAPDQSWRREGSMHCFLQQSGGIAEAQARALIILGSV
ncbi:hypothetical protein [Streptosporangium saharense]|uniref:Uncharacterized protein n=1 Tax=Streptosporangium saharense TaxID=1706840 RepID=A0A7W7VKW6_9ACTN|nr:hypothetical protein [Streptosporangium saharense]MBB4913560.1 hypothetical protein [Streptosporangium saharense]